MAFEPIASTSSSREFQAVILAGPGDDLSPLTSDTLPKALLPIGNKPIVEGVLKWLEEAQLLDVLLLAPNSQQSELSAYTRSRRSSSDSELRIDIETYDAEQVQGTAQVLRWAHLQKHIKYDPVILPCDLCLLPNATTTSNALVNLLDAHRLGSNLVTSLFYERAASNEEKMKDGASFLVAKSLNDDRMGPPPIMSIVDPASNTLLDCKDMADFDDEIELRSSLFDHYSKALLTTSLLQAHVYVCSQRVLKILEAIPTFRSIKEDFVPFLCKLQWQTALLKKYADSALLHPPPHPQAIALCSSTTQRPAPTDSIDALDADPSSPLVKKRPALRTLLTRTSAADLKASGGGLSQHMQEVACGIRVWKKADGFCARANSVEALHEAHRILLPIIVAASRQTSSPQLPALKQVGSDSVVGANLIVGEKSTIKKSSIGRNVQIGKDCKISACIVMDGAVLGDSVKMDNCIVCPQARISNGCNLSKCEVASKTEIGQNTTAKNEKLSDLSD